MCLNVKIETNLPTEKIHHLNAMLIMQSHIQSTSCSMWSALNVSNTFPLFSISAF